MYTYRSYFDSLAFKQFTFTTAYNGLSEAEFLKKVSQVVRGVILTNSVGADETLDFGGDISKGGYKFEVAKLKRYLLAIADDAAAFLRSSSGEILYTMDFIYLVSQILKKRGRYEDAIKFLYAGFLYNASDIYAELTRILKSRGKSMRIGHNSYTDSSKYFKYYNKYMMYMTIPNGYKCYLFEPENLIQTVLLMRLGNLTPLKCKQYLNKHSDEGILISEIGLNDETVLYNPLLRNVYARMTGYFGNVFKSECKKCYNENDNKNYYYDVLLNDLLGLMTKLFLDKYLSDLSCNPELTETDCFINYMTPISVSVCIRDDLNINDILPSLAEKMKDVGSFSLYNPLNFV